MKDCSSCKQKPKAGVDYKKTPCRFCQAWEPSNNRSGTQEQKPSWWWDKYDNKKAEGIDRLIRY